jgi:hypothetical protein
MYHHFKKKENTSQFNIYGGSEKEGHQKMKNALG